MAQLHGGHVTADPAAPLRILFVILRVDNFQWGTHQTTHFLSGLAQESNQTGPSLLFTTKMVQTQRVTKVQELGKPKGKGFH